MHAAKQTNDRRQFKVQFRVRSSKKRAKIQQKLAESKSKIPSLSRFLPGSSQSPKQVAYQWCLIPGRLIMRTEFMTKLLVADDSAPLALFAEGNAAVFAQRGCLETSITSRSALPPRWAQSRAKPMELHQLKRRLLRAALQETSNAILSKRLCGAANQAADLAWSTAHPLLVFPCLFEELANNLRQVIFDF
jgi:hypothetical protein